MQYSTRNDLPESTRKAVIDLLNQQLADLLVLGLQAKQAHWNVKGPNFIGLHELFDKIADALVEPADELAERAVELGGVAFGTIQAIQETSRLEAYSVNLSSGKSHVIAIANSLSCCAAAMRTAIDTAATLNDAGTSDLFTGISRVIDKLLWMVEAHLHADE